MHSGRISQCYINITRNTFIAKTSRGCNASSKNKGKQAKGENMNFKKRKQNEKKMIQQRKKYLSRDQSRTGHADKANVKWEN